MSQSNDASGGNANVLEPVGRGAQGDVFGTERWVVKVRRVSTLGVLALGISRWQNLGEVGGALGGLAAPFLVLGDVVFRAPKMNGRGKVIEYRRRRAIARERYPVDDFLDHQLSMAEPARALALVEEMVTLVERARARGFYMHDFIMRNFVLVEGRLMIADTGLITPLRAFRDPAVRLCARGFSRGLAKDYQRLLGEVRDEITDDDALSQEIASFSEALPERLGRLRRDPIRDLEPESKVPIKFDLEIEKEIREVLGSVR